MHALTKSALLLCAAVTVSSFDLGSQDVVFHLFTRNNPTQSEPLWPDLDSIMRSEQLILSRRTVITIHSNGESVAGNFNAFLIPAYLQVADVNLFAVDWNLGSSMYTIGLGNAPQLGEIVATFMNILVEQFAYGVDQIEIVGVGLGGHVAGIAARNIQGQVPRVVALDPSLHGWTYHPDKLTPNDAQVVEVLHTTAGLLGYDLPLGTLDFYPNGGSTQAGCATVDCSHIYSYAFYAESLTAEVNDGDKFVATECANLAAATSLNCEGESDIVFGGTEVKIGESGIYSFITNFVPPFARG